MSYYSQPTQIRIPQDAANDLALAVRRRERSRIIIQAWLLACAGNKVEVTEENFAPWVAEFNEVTKDVYRILWDLYNAGYGERPGKAPVMKFSAKVSCDTRCTHAKGAECVCSCGGINHGTFSWSLAHCQDPDAEVSRIKKQNAEELKALNADPIARLLHLFGVRKRQELVRRT